MLERGLKQADRNANDNISLIQTAEGALNEVGGIISRMRERAVQASNEGTMDTTERGYLDQEFTLIKVSLTVSSTSPSTTVVSRWEHLGGYRFSGWYE